MKSKKTVTKTKVLTDKELLEKYDTGNVVNFDKARECNFIGKVYKFQ